MIDGRSVGEILNDLRLRAGLSMDDLAKRMGFAGQSSIQRYLHQEYIKPLRGDLARKFAHAMDGLGNPPISANDVIVLTTKITTSFSESIAQRAALGIDPGRRVDNFPLQTVPGEQLVGARDFPIYAAAQGGNGHMIVHTDVMEYVKRPVILEGVPDSYGILITGTSMVPAFRPNDMALVHPRRPPERDTDVILFDHDHRTGDAKAMVKRLIGFNDRSWKLEQYNPAETFSEHRADWPLCHQVVGKYNAR